PCPAGPAGEAGWGRSLTRPGRAAARPLRDTPGPPAGPKAAAPAGPGVSVPQLLDVDVLEPQRVAVVLELDRAPGRQRPALLPVVGQRGVVHHLLAVEEHRHPVALHDDAEGVPLADRPVRLLERVLAGGAGRVVPQAAGALALVRRQQAAE